MVLGDRSLWERAEVRVSMFECNAAKASGAHCVIAYLVVVLRVCELQWSSKSNCCSSDRSVSAEVRLRHLRPFHRGLAAKFVACICVRIKPHSYPCVFVEGACFKIILSRHPCVFVEHACIRGSICPGILASLLSL